ncbi:hypothetical protein KC324_g18655, partial [Hortaea werneckii]
RLLGPRPFEERGEFTKYFGGGPMPGGPTKPGPEGEPEPPGNLPPPIGGQGGEPAPTLYQGFEDAGRSQKD